MRVSFLTLACLLAVTASPSLCGPGSPQPRKLLAAARRSPPNTRPPPAPRPKPKAKAPPPPRKASPPPPLRKPPPRPPLPRPPQPRPPPKAQPPPAKPYVFAPPTGAAFDIGSPSVRHLWVDPAGGSDGNSGASRGAALRTFSAAWQLVPKFQALSRGWHIHVAPGAFTEDERPQYWEGALGTHRAPVIVEAADGRGTVAFPIVNVFNCSFLYFINVNISSGGGDVFHCERCTGLLLRGVTITGAAPSTYAVQEAAKLNQCTGVYIEGCDISGAWDNAVDMVAVQYGHILGSRLHSAGWCVYQKGGSAYHLVAGNEIFDCGESGYAAGQGTGFEYMVPPWIRYEAYDIKVVNNVIRDVYGAGLGVYGGYDILFAHNTLTRVGARSHAIEVKFGSRSCDGDTQLLGTCARHLAAGGWGPGAPTGGDEALAVSIPNQNVIIANNLLYNPSPYRSQWQHFQLDDPAHWSSPSTEVRADNGVVILGNVLWNGPADLPLGFGEDGACSGGGLRCSAAAVRAQNAINTVDPLLDAAYRPAASAAAGLRAVLQPLSDFGPWAAGLGAPAGNLTNVVDTDRGGAARAGRDLPGAYV